MAQTQTGVGAPGPTCLTCSTQRQPTAFYWKLTILACLGGFLFGYDTSNIGAALNFVPYHLSSFWLGLSGGRRPRWALRPGRSWPS